MKKIVLPIVALALSLSMTYGQKLTLKECVDEALKNNLTVRRSLYNVKSSEISFLQSRGNFLPTISARASLTQNYGRTLNPLTYSYVNTMTKSIQPGLTASLPLFNTGRIVNTYRQNKKSVEAADLDLEKAKNDVIITVVTNYTNVILNKELLENSKFQLNSSQQQLERIQKQVAAGALPKSNELTQEATVATNETNVITQENTYNLSLLQLKQSMQVPASDSLEVVIPELAFEDMTINQTPQEIYAVSVKTLPQVRSAQLKVESARYAMKAAWGNYIPTVSLIAGANSNYSSASDNRKVYTTDLTTYGKNPLGGVVDVNGQPVFQYAPIQSTPYTISKYGVASQLNDYFTKYVGFSVNIPISNGFQTRTALRQQVVNKDLAEITVKETENALRQSIETAYNNAIAAAKTYTAAVKQVNANEEAFRMVQQRHQIGAATYIEYQVASNDLYSAKSGLARAKYNFILTKKILEFYQGKSIEY
jgi:outer membrane protein